MERKVLNTVRFCDPGFPFYPFLVGDLVYIFYPSSRHFEIDAENVPPGLNDPTATIRLRTVDLTTNTMSEELPFPPTKLYQFRCHFSILLLQKWSSNHFRFSL